MGHCNTPARAAADSRGAANGGGFPLPAADLVDVVRSLDLERPFVFAHSVLATLALHAEALAPGLWAAAYLYEPVASVTPAQVRCPAAQPGSGVSAGSAASAAVLGGQVCGHRTSAAGAPHCSCPNPQPRSHRLGSSPATRGPAVVGPAAVDPEHCGQAASERQQARKIDSFCSLSAAMCPALVRAVACGVSGAVLYRAYFPWRASRWIRSNPSGAAPLRDSSERAALAVIGSDSPFSAANPAGVCPTLAASLGGTSTSAEIPPGCSALVRAQVAMQVEANRVAGRMLATGARARRRRWESAAAALASLRARPGFSPLTDRALQAYVESCCTPCADGAPRPQHVCRWRAGCVAGVARGTGLGHMLL